MTGSRNTGKPPLILERILESLQDYLPLEPLGDFEEDYRRIRSEKGRFRADVWYFRQVLIALCCHLAAAFNWGFGMLKNYLKIVLRRFRKHKINSSVNVFGFSIGFAFCFLVLLYVTEELSFDKFHKDSDSIYSVVSTIYRYQMTARFLPTPAGPVLKEAYPEIKDFLRLSGRRSIILKYGEKAFNENPLFTDPNFFGFFSFELLKGDQESVLESPDSIVMTSRAAEKYFGDENPIGKSFAAILGGTRKDLIVTGLAKNPPENSSIQFDFLLNIENMKHIRGEDFLTYWISFSTHLFLLLDERASPTELEEKLQGFADEYLMQNANLEVFREKGFLGPDGRPCALALENIQDIHFSRNVDGGMTVRANDIRSLYVLLGIAFVMIVLVCFNYLNITLGGASHREIEIGIRKILGAGRRQMTLQFFFETAAYLIFGVISGLFLASLMIDPFNRIMNKQLKLVSLLSGSNILILSLSVIVFGLLAALFPGMSLSKFKPAAIFNGKLKIGKKGTFSKLPVVLQFAISFFLLVSMLVMARQILFLKSQDIGFDNENLVIIETVERRSTESERIYSRYKEIISQNPNILGVTGSGSAFHRITYGGGGIVNGGRVINGNSNRVHYDFVQTLGLRLIAGRDFSPEFPTDETAAIVNEKLVREMGLENPIGTVIRNGGDVMPDFQIIGVVNDSKLASLEDEIKPLFLHMFPGTPRVQLPINYVFVRITGDQVFGTMQYLEKTWKELFPDKPFQSAFADEDIERSLGELKKWRDIVKYSGILAVLVTGIGLFCLTSLIVSTRIKEIGIRKVLGASTPGIYRHLTSEFFVLVAVGCLISCPLSYYFMNRWLQNYANRITISGIEFLIAGVVSIFVSLATASYHALKTANADPVDSLRHE